MKNSTRPLIGVDLDDTVWQFMRRMCAFHNEQYGTTHDGLHHFTTWHLHETWRCTAEEAVSRIAHFVFSAAHGEILAAPGAVASLTVLAQRYHLVAITAREPERAPPTLELLERLFGDLFAASDVHFLGHTKKKGDLCVELGIHLMIDDALHNAQSVSEKGIPVILLDMPWNQGALPNLTTRVLHWDEIPTLVRNIAS